MKRYQCIKTLRHELFEFEPGEPYNFTVNPGGNFYGHKTQTGRIIWLTSQQIRDHFHELMDLNVDEIEEARQDNDEPRGCAGIVYATVITILIVILYAIFA
jgi:hypothetical protein